MRATMASVPELPSSAVIHKMFEVARGSIEALGYFAKRLESVFKSAGVLDTPAVSNKLNQMVGKVDEAINELFSHSNPWAGQIPKNSGFKNKLENIAVDASRAFDRESQVQYTIDMAVSDSSHYIRGYSGGGKPDNDSETASKFDKLFNAWLASNNMGMQGSILYRADENGNILNTKGKIHNATDIDSKPQLIKPEEAKAAIHDQSNGFEHYLKEKGINVTVRAQPYTAPQKTQDSRAEPESPSQGTRG